MLCDFAPISEEDCVEMWNLATGFNHTVESYLQAGERIWNLIRLFNLREGLPPNGDTLPDRFFNQSFTKGPAKGKVLDKKDFERSLQQYYTLRGWAKQGIPSKKTCQLLGLNTYYEQIIS